MAPIAAADPAPAAGRGLAVTAQVRRFSRQADALTLRIQPLLAGHGPELQGAVLADLCAIWIAGHRCSDPAQERQIHEELLALHEKFVRELVQNYVDARS
jgi:hypothetical protein